MQIVNISQIAMYGNSEDDAYGGGGCMKQNFVNNMGVAFKDWVWFLIAGPPHFDTLRLLPTTCKIRIWDEFEKL